MKNFYFLLLLFALAACKKEPHPLTLEQRLEQLPDSITVENITVYNAFKYQILAHNSKGYDSLMIINKVYRPHNELWDGCYAMIFGEENASKFNTKAGFIQWNKTLYPDNRMEFDKIATSYLSYNIDSLFRVNLIKFNKIVPHAPKLRMSIAFVPFQGIGFGGCADDMFVYELNNPDYDLKFSLEKGVPHEFNHAAYEPFRKKDPLGETALGQTIDEGFACYFTWAFFDRKEPKEIFVENMTKKEWDWYLAHEKEIFAKCKPYFMDKSGDNPLLRNDKLRLFPDAPHSLNYWLGFRIVELYVIRHGKDSWKNIYTLPMKKLYEESGYEQYINTLK